MSTRAGAPAVTGSIATRNMHSSMRAGTMSVATPRSNYSASVGYCFERRKKPDLKPNGSERRPNKARGTTVGSSGGSLRAAVLSRSKSVGSTSPGAWRATTTAHTPGQAAVATPLAARPRPIVAGSAGERSDDQVHTLRWLRGRERRYIVLSAGSKAVRGAAS